MKNKYLLFLIAIGLIVIMYSRSISSHQTNGLTLITGLTLVVTGVALTAIQRGKSK